MNNIVMRKVDVTPSYQPLVAESLVASVTVSALPTNGAPVYLRGDDGTDVAWQPGECHVFQRVDLVDLYVKGTAGDSVSIVGGTW